MISAVVVLLVSVPVFAAAQPSARCFPQMAALRTVQQQIDVHNAQPHVFYLPQQAAQFHAYNAEAAQLNATQAAALGRLQACRAEAEALAKKHQQALDELAAKGPGSPQHRTTAPVPSQQKLLDATRNLTPNRMPRPPPPPGKNWTVTPGTPERTVWQILRENNPGGRFDATTRLQGAARPKVGDPDPRLPGRTIQPVKNKPLEPDVVGDHIVPLARIVHMPGFMRLNPDNMWAVARAPLNLQWMSWGTNSAKSSRYVGGMSGVSPAWRASQDALQKRVEAQLQDLINRLLSAQI